MNHTITIDDNAFKILQKAKSELKDKGHNNASYNEAIRHLDRLRSDPV